MSAFAIGVSLFGNAGPVQWFGCHQKYPFMQAVIAKTKYKFYLVGLAYGLAVGGDNGAEQRPSQEMSTGITLEMYDLKL